MRMKEKSKEIRNHRTKNAKCKLRIKNAYFIGSITSTTS